MRIEDLQLFSDIVRYHSISIAAEKNYMTSQNLSKIIRKLEEEFDTVLFTRSRKGTELTVEGEKYYLKILKILLEYNELKNLISTMNEDIYNNEMKELNLKILCHEGGIYYAILNTYNIMAKEKLYNIVLDIDINKAIDIGTDYFYRHLEENDYDIIALFSNQRDIDTMVSKYTKYIPIGTLEDEAVLLVSKQNPLANRKVIFVEELKTLKFALLKNNISIFFSKLVKPIILVDTISAMIDSVESSDTICSFAYKNMLNMNKMLKGKVDNLVTIPIDQKFYGAFHILLNKESFNTEGASEFAKKLADVYSSEQAY